MSRRKQAKPRSVKAVEEGESSEFAGNWDSSSVQTGIRFVIRKCAACQAAVRSATQIRFYMSHSRSTARLPTESESLISIPHGPECSALRERGMREGDMA
ncbi:unnamed protein product [Oncorhynchus mykiss]|uniref:Uncharacterized protein n=1 Tax=Oncorhynchus mykiss TaxID=8022 RepID=A0A060Y5R6_ONCMY|nr:unnamed protein product [Oncorhynchus mykiss]